MPVRTSSAPVGSSQSRTSGPLGDGPGDGHALLLAAGQLRREMVQARAEVDQFQRGFGRHRVAGDLGNQPHVLPRGQARDQVVELEDEADALRGGRR